MYLLPVTQLIFQYVLVTWKVVKYCQTRFYSGLGRWSCKQVIVRKPTAICTDQSGSGRGDHMSIKSQLVSLRSIQLYHSGVVTDHPIGHPISRRGSFFRPVMI